MLIKKKKITQFPDTIQLREEKKKGECIII